MTGLLTGPATSALVLHVVHVLSLSTQKQVRRVDTSGRITPVQNLLPIRYRTVGKFPRYPMAEFTHTLTNIDTPVSVAGSMPEPTSIGTVLINPFPKPIANGPRSRSVGASHRTVIALLVSTAQKYLAAYRAGALRLSSWYSTHVVASLQVITKPGMYPASPGLSMSIIPQMARLADARRVGRVL